MPVLNIFDVLILNICHEYFKLVSCHKYFKLVSCHKYFKLINLNVLFLLEFREANIKNMTKFQNCLEDDKGHLSVNKQITMLAVI